MLRRKRSWQRRPRRSAAATFAGARPRSLLKRWAGWRTASGCWNRDDGRLRGWLTRLILARWGAACCAPTGNASHDLTADGWVMHDRRTKLVDGREHLMWHRLICVQG